MASLNIVLIIPYRGIGDLIFHLPLIRSLKKKFDKKIILITNKQNKAKNLLRYENSIKKIEYTDFTRENLFNNSINLIKKINKYKPEVSILTHYSKRLVIPFMLSKSIRKIRFKSNNIKDIAKYISNQQKIHFPNIKFLDDYKIKLPFKKNRKKNLFINIDSHHNQNNWPEINFINLIEQLILKKNLNKIYVNFAPNKINNFTIIKKRFDNHKKIHFTYEKKFDDLIHILNSCEFIIGNESGPICLGASLGKKVISLFSPNHTPHKSSGVISPDVIYFNTIKNKKNKVITSILNFI